MADHVKPALGCDFFALFRHDTGGVGSMFKGDGQHLSCCRHFKIERLGDLCHQPADIMINDMAPVFTQMCRDAIGAAAIAIKAASTGSGEHRHGHSAEWPHDRYSHPTAACPYVQTFVFLLILRRPSLSSLIRCNCLRMRGAKLYPRRKNSSPKMVPVTKPPTIIEIKTVPGASRKVA